MKVCSLYGAGFYYIPGTDICLKVGAYFRAEYAVGNMAASLTNLDTIGVDGQRTRLTGPDYQQRARAFIFLDSRQQTAYGTLRAYFNVGNSNDFPQQVGTSAAAIYANRAFIQLAGFTWGIATSYYDFYSSPATSYTVPWSSDTGDGGWKVAAYTAQLGNGLSATFSLEEPRRQVVTNNSFINTATVQTYPVGSLPLQDELKVKWPDIVGNLRIDQAWGSAQIMGSLHQVGGRYYSGDFPNGQATSICNVPNTNNCSHPDDKWGWAVGAGLTLKMPWDAKDTLSGVIAYAEGNSRAVAFGNTNNFLFKSQGIAQGVFSDGIFSAPGRPVGNVGKAYDGGIELTTTWGGTVAFEHYWTPALRTSWVFGYVSVEYSDQVKALLQASGNAANIHNCAASGLRSPGPIGTKNNTFACDPDWSVWRATSRTMWNPVANLDVGLEIAYTKLNTAYEGFAVSSGNINQGLAPGRYNITDVDVWSATLRVQRSFWP